MSNDDPRPVSQRNRPEDSPGGAGARRDVLGLWTGILAGPVLWFTHQQVSFVLVPWICDHGGVMWLHATTVVLLLGTVAAGLLSRRYWLREEHDARCTDETAAAAIKLAAVPVAAGAPSIPPPRTAGQQRVRFMAILGVLSSLFFGLVIIAQEIPNFFIDPCQR